MSEGNGRRSLARRSSHARLTAFDGVKLELALIVLLAASLAFVILLLKFSAVWELVLLAAVGSGCGVWIWLRTQQVFRRLRRRLESGD